MTKNLKKPFLIGLSGQSCAGKNTVSSILEKKGFFCIDADKISTSLFSVYEQEIFAMFKPELIKAKLLSEEEGKIKADKKEFALMIFSQKKLLQKLENFILPKIAGQIHTEIQKQFAVNPKTPIVLNAPTLHKTDLIKHCNFIFYVKAPKIIRIIRALKRDKISLKKILARFSKQNDFFAQYFFLNADIVVVKNSGSIKKMENVLLQELTKRGFKV